MQLSPEINRLISNIEHSATAIENAAEVVNVSIPQIIDQPFEDELANNLYTLGLLTYFILMTITAIATGIIRGIVDFIKRLVFRERRQ